MSSRKRPNRAYVGEYDNSAPFYVIGTHDFTIEEMLANHDGVYSSRVLECQEREPTGAPRCIAHDGTGVDLAKLTEIPSECFYSTSNTTKFINDCI